ncbi:MAG: hypothetical protein PHU71_06695 [Candidatus Gracilibacteria bacterium]|nr:hypothetical protein [Candidatus Gracilibacteria bacterium]
MLGFIAKNDGIIKELFTAGDAKKINLIIRAKYFTAGNAKDAEKSKGRREELGFIAKNDYNKRTF